MRPERRTGRGRLKRWGSMRHDLALREASGAPAGRGLSHLCVHVCHVVLDVGVLRRLLLRQLCQGRAGRGDHRLWPALPSKLQGAHRALPRPRRRHRTLLPGRLLCAAPATPRPSQRHPCNTCNLRPCNHRPCNHRPCNPRSAAPATLRAPVTAAWTTSSYPFRVRVWRHLHTWLGTSTP